MVRSMMRLLLLFFITKSSNGLVVYSHRSGRLASSILGHPTMGQSHPMRPSTVSRPGHDPHGEDQISPIDCPRGCPALSSGLSCCACRASSHGRALVRASSYDLYRSWLYCIRLGCVCQVSLHSIRWRLRHRARGP